MQRQESPHWAILQAWVGDEVRYSWNLAPAASPPMHSNHDALSTLKTQEAASALNQLAAARQTPASPTHAATLLAAAMRLAHAHPHSAALALGLLARWARLCGPSAKPQEAEVLRAAVAAGMGHLVEPGLARPTGAASVLLLGAAATALPTDEQREAAAAVCGALAAAQRAPAAQAGDVAAGVLSLMAVLLASAHQDAHRASLDLLRTLLHFLSLLDGTNPASLDALAPLYGGMRSVAVSALASGSPASVVPAVLRPAYAVLRSAGPTALPAAAAAALGLGGLLEGMLRAAAGYPACQLLAAEAEDALLAASACAEAEAGPEPASSLLVDACALATVQLAQGAQRLVAPPPALLRCHARALLHTVLPVHAFCAAAAAGKQPEVASALLQQQLGSALGQQAATLARGLADGLCRGGDPATASWLLQQLAARAQETCDQYAAYSVSSPEQWMAAADAVALRQLLERTFLSALVLLDGTWRAAATAADPPAARAAASTTSIGILAQLQFCRVHSDQYAGLLKQALTELPGAPAGAAAAAAALPCYEVVAAACPARHGAPRWVADAVSAAKAQFIFNALAVCADQLPEVRGASHSRIDGKVIMAWTAEIARIQTGVEQPHVVPAP